MLQYFACSENVSGPSYAGVWNWVVPRRSTQISTQLGGLTMAYAERRERKKGVRYRGIYKAAGGRYQSAGTFSTEERALVVALEAERHAAEVAGGAAGGLDPGTRATRTIKEYAPLFLRHHQVEGNTKDTYADTLRLHVIPFLGGCRLAETDRAVASPRCRRRDVRRTRSGRPRWCSARCSVWRWRTAIWITTRS